MKSKLQDCMISTFVFLFTDLSAYLLIEKLLKNIEADSHSTYPFKSFNSTDCKQFNLECWPQGIPIKDQKLYVPIVWVLYS